MNEGVDLTYYQRIPNVKLNRAKGYHKNDKKRLREQARDKYRNLSEEEKNKKKAYGKNRHCNMSEEKKQILKEYQTANGASYYTDSSFPQKDLFRGW